MQHTLARIAYLNYVGACNQSGIKPMEFDHYSIAFNAGYRKGHDNGVAQGYHQADVEEKARYE